MKYIATLYLGLAFAIAPAITRAQNHLANESPYAGFETRAIKSLSETDLTELRNGGGWGFALAAELNGIPGPAHLLELRDEIPLADEQVAAIQVIFSQMQDEAIGIGANLIAAEGAIEAAFRAGDLDDAHLRSLIAEAEAARAQLRFIHLSRHLSTASLLQTDQIARYNSLRGYGQDVCVDVPEGHDPEMWLRHNNCS